MSFLSFFKYVLFIFNFLVMLLGGALLTVAIYFYVDTLQYIDISARMWPAYSIFFLLIIGVGLLTFIVGFFGCCGACKESSCMLCLYFTIIVALCTLVGVIIFLPDKLELKPHQIKADLRHDIKEIIQKSYSRYNTSSFANMIIDKIQDEFQCCGSNNYTDWMYSLQNNVTRPDLGVNGDGRAFIVATENPRTNVRPKRQSFFNQQQQQANQHPTTTTSFRVPPSCCSRGYNENSYNQCKTTIARYDSNPFDQQMVRIPNVNTEGCVDKIYHYLFVVNWWPLNIIGGLAIGLQGLSLIFSLCLCCAINRAIDDDDYEDEKRI